MKYHDQIKHPLWQKKRLEVLEDRSFQCENCGDIDQELHIHHPYYKRGAMIWDYDKDELQCLCYKCHKNEHAIDENIKFLLANKNVNKEMILGSLKAMTLNPNTELDTIDQIYGFLSIMGSYSKYNENLLLSVGGKAFDAPLIPVNAI